MRRGTATLIHDKKNPRALNPLYTESLFISSLHQGVGRGRWGQGGRRCVDPRRRVVTMWARSRAESKKLSARLREARMSPSFVDLGRCLRVSLAPLSFQLHHRVLHISRRYPDFKTETHQENTRGGLSSSFFFSTFFFHFFFLFEFQATL